MKAARAPRKRTPQPIPIEPHAWSLWGEDVHDAHANADAHRTFSVRLPKARRAGQRVSSKYGSLRLLWCADVTDDLTVCALARDRETIALVLQQQGYTVADYTPDAVPGRSRDWHQRRAVANAKEMATIMRATAREWHVAEPIGAADIAWLQRQLGTLEEN